MIRQRERTLSLEEQVLVGRETMVDKGSLAKLAHVHSSVPSPENKGLKLSSVVNLRSPW